MKRIFFCFFLAFLLLGCTQEVQHAALDWQTVSDRVRFRSAANSVELQSGKFSYRLEKLPLQKVVLLNASLVGYFSALGLEKNIVGISSPEYVYSQKLRQQISAGSTQNVGSEQKYDLERIIALRPDAVFTNYIPNFENAYDLLRKNGIQVIFIDEYLENNPLAKAACLKVFGILFRKADEAEVVFSTIKQNYDALRRLASTAQEKPVVLANELYGNQWYLPGGKSALAKFLSDANSRYINASNTSVTAVPMSFEEVFAKAQQAKYWVNVGNHPSRRSLLQSNSSYAKMEVFRSGKMYTLNGRAVGKTNDYFESGVVRADLVLKDYIKILHPELLPEYTLTYLKELN